MRLRASARHAWPGTEKRGLAMKDEYNSILSILTFFNVEHNEVLVPQTSYFRCICAGERNGLFRKMKKTRDLQIVGSPWLQKLR